MNVRSGCVHFYIGFFFELFWIPFYDDSAQIDINVTFFFFNVCQVCHQLKKYGYEFDNFFENEKNVLFIKDQECQDYNCN
jgi:hypothetical protein